MSSRRRWRRAISTSEKDTRNGLGGEMGGIARDIFEEGVRTKLGILCRVPDRFILVIKTSMHPHVYGHPPVTNNAAVGGLSLSAFFCL